MPSTLRFLRLAAVVWHEQRCLSTWLQKVGGGRCLTAGLAEWGAGAGIQPSAWFINPGERVRLNGEDELSAVGATHRHDVASVIPKRKERSYAYIADIQPSRCTGDAICSGPAHLAADISSGIDGWAFSSSPAVEERTTDGNDDIGGRARRRLRAGLLQRVTSAHANTD